MVKLKVGGQPLTFMVDTGTEHSVVTTPVAPLTGRKATIVGETGSQTTRQLCGPRACQLGRHTVTHEFLYLPECTVPPLSRDLLTKLGAQIAFIQGGPTGLSLGRPNSLIMAVTVPAENECRVYFQEKGDPTVRTCLLDEFPDVWAEKGPPGLALNHTPIVEDLKPGALPVRQRQYPVPREALLVIEAHLQRLKDAGILIERQSPWNTPLLPVKKTGGSDYQPLQDLRAVNSAIVTLHPVVPNPCTCLSLLPPQASRFTCLDLKAAFFCLRVAPASQSMFAFEREDPHTRRKTQMTWTTLPQGFKNSPQYLEKPWRLTCQNAWIQWRQGGPHISGP